MEVFSSRKMLLIWLLVVMTPSPNIECRSPVLHRVGGGKNNWKLGTSFTEWASHEKFYIGDWLYFGFNKSMFTVLEVNKKSFDLCIEKYYICNVTRGGRDVFNLTEARPYYFISGRGYCSKGMKLAINVECAPPPSLMIFSGSAPAPTAVISGSPAIIPLVLASFLTWTIISNRLI